jgi:hypothetical protein
MDTDNAKDWAMWQPPALGTAEFTADDQINAGNTAAHTLEYRRDDKPNGAIAIYVYPGAYADHPNDWFVIYSFWRTVGDTPDVPDSETWGDYDTIAIESTTYPSTDVAATAAIRVAQIIASGDAAAIADIDPRILTDVLDWDGDPYELDPQCSTDRDS